jgi:hypothetical protein
VRLDTILTPQKELDAVGGDPAALDLQRDGPPGEHLKQPGDRPGALVARAELVGLATGAWAHARPSAACAGWSMSAIRFRRMRRS